MLKRVDNRENASFYGAYRSGLDPEVVAKYADRAITLECDPGDVIFFSNLLFHRGGNNEENIVRWSADWRLVQHL